MHLRLSMGQAFGLLVMAVSSSNVFASCAMPKPLRLHGQTLADAKPRLAWDTVTGATEYRVRLQSRVPNGKVISSHDTIVSSSSFVPPLPLAEHHAKVVVRLNAICGKEASAESVSSFVIDTSSTCILGGFDAGVAGGKANLKWAPVSGATSYEVRAYAIPDGKLIASHEARTPAAQLDLRGAAVVSVRPSCTTGYGEAVYRVVTTR
jgi:hypothetical protein